MPTLRESLQEQLQLTLSRRLSTRVPSPVLVESASDCADAVATWLQEIYDLHSVALEVFGDPAPTPIRPSYEWLCESMKA